MWALRIFLIFVFNFSKVYSEDFLFQETIYEAHEALWDTFVPFYEIEKDSTLKELLKKAKKDAFEKIAYNQKLKAALLLLGNIHSLHDSLLLNIYYLFLEKDEETRAKINSKNLKPIKNFIENLNNHCFFVPLKSLEKSQKLELLALMQRSPINLIRRIAFYLRLFYLNEIYSGPLGAFISGIIPKTDEISPIMPTLPKFFTDLRYDEESKSLIGEIDALIVGSGASGSVAAYNLQKAGFKVLVIEKGPLVIPGAINTTDNFRFLDEKGLRMSENGSLILLNANVAGGGPTVNIDLSFPPTLPYIEHRFDTWHNLGIIPKSLWNKEEIKNAYEWVHNVFLPRNIEPHELNENNAILKLGALKLNIPTKWFSLNTYKNGESPHEVTNKKSSLEKLLIPSMTDKRNPLTLLTSCRVKKVLIKSNKSYGVRCEYEAKDKGLGLINDLYGFNIKDKTTLTIKAKTVVLAAGNLGTSAILLSSHIKNQNIGKGFIVHPFVPIGGLFERPIFANEGLPSSIFVDHFLPTKQNPDAPGFLIESAAGQASLGALLMPGAPRQVLEKVKNSSFLGGLGVILADSPHEDNYIAIDDKEEPRVYFNLSQSDKKRFIIGLKTAINILFAAGATDVFFNSFEKPFFMYDEIFANTIKPDMDLDELFKDFSFLPNKNLLMGAHMMGSNKMGLDPKTSVVNPDYEVFGVKNLYVIDSSIFPTSVGANPMQTIYTVAKIFADKFIAKYTD